MVELKPTLPDDRNAAPQLSLRSYDAKPSRSAMALIVATLSLSVVGAAIPLVVSVATPHQTNMYAKPILDDDGDDMRYHWQNPAYGDEEGLHMGAIALAMGSVIAFVKFKRPRARSSK